MLKNRKIALFVGCFAVLALMLQFNLNNKLDFPTCEDKKLLVTDIAFFVDIGVLERNKKVDVENRIIDMLGVANSTLENSCINLQRRLDTVYYEDLQNIPQQGTEYALKHDELIWKMDSKKRELFITNPTKYIVAIYKQLPGDVIGYTHAAHASRFVVLSYEANNFALEHELGHLALAGHESNDEPRLFGGSAKIAHAYRCGNVRSIMNEDRSSGDLAPFYSSPNIRFKNESCGLLNDANNTEQLIRWTRLLEANIDLYQSLGVID
ncbi:hypothetical protein [Vibrio ulleungensis]|uniref:Uncharacterized protein n=1 Tax=Vibrio ulleungensis TaxID=2807619 RepID=A0ABS2HL70_9VIBR|nr:hypothetical protein [Vibrio ulleungensis]MBM7038225.1 hypothetical protein [Vibrio ulleungensis]